MKPIRISNAFPAILAMASFAPAASPESVPAFVQPVRSEMVSASFRNRVQSVIEKPSLRVFGPVETFRCQPSVYRWLLDHPDRAVTLWQQMGAQVAEISDRGNGQFGWKDELGSDVWWESVYTSPRQRIWYAEGKVKGGPLLPMVPFKAVIALHMQEGHDAAGKPALRHRGELFIHTDSKAAALAMKIIGPAGPRMAEQYAAQIEMFYSGLAWYLDEHPEKLAKLLME